MRKALLRKLKEKTQEEFLYLNNKTEHTFLPKELQKRKKENVGFIEPVRMIHQMRFCEIPIHTHQDIEICYTCSGTVLHKIDGNFIQLGKGELLLMSNKVSHEIKKTSENDVALIFILQSHFINEIFLHDLWKNDLTTYFYKILLGMIPECSYLVFRTAENNQIQNLMENIIIALMGNEQTNYQMMSLNWELVFLHLVKSFQNQFIKKEDLNSDLMMKIISYIESNYQTASLQELSKQLELSTVNLSRLIKKHSSCTFTELLLDKRFKVAENLLIYSNLAISEIIVKLGYENGSYFYQKFYERFGMTPNEFRLKYAQKETLEKENRKMYLQNKIGQYWTDRAESYSEQNQIQLSTDSFTKWKNVILEHIPDKETLSILDIGTGPGFFAVLLAKEGYQVTAIDQNRNMLYYARQNAKQAGVNIQFQQVEEDLPFEDESFDFIISRDVTWMQLEPEKVLKSWYRILKKEGVLLYFDAEWYGYLGNENKTKEYKTYRKMVKEKAGFIYSKANNMERMAMEFPLTYKKRPQWDEEFWKELHPQEILIKTQLNSRVYSEIEQLQYAKTPEFLVYVKK